MTNLFSYYDYKIKYSNKSNMILPYYSCESTILISMQIRFDRNRTSTVILIYSLYLYSLGLSLRNTSNALVIL